MKDVTSTSFGLLIAFLLPGLLALFGFALWEPSLASIFNTFLTAESNLGLFLLVILGAILTSLEISLVRWLLFELLLCRRHRLTPADFSELGAQGKLKAFQGAVEEHYRYHQFWGGIAIVIPFLYAGWARQAGLLSMGWRILGSLVGFLLIEGLTVAGAIQAYTNYVQRARHILRGE
jgi:hypothetical protein